MTDIAQNRLATTASPYLLQHAGNPVAWQPWDDQAIALARETGRPILLSVGYSACHWCHVMAHESFEDADTAEVMNAHFVNVKVDREERPDLDRIYQLAHQLLNQQGGGWPLTAFLDPDTLVPFFSGTYFPRTSRHGLPSFVDVLTRIATVFAERRDELREQGTRLSALFERLDDAADAENGSAENGGAEALWQAARATLGGQYDAAAGGFGRAPKFPMPAAVDALLQGWDQGRRRGDADREALDMVMTTLTRMARGGIYDHLGGGFCRYATDRHWHVPHFEKMLYDNAQLLSLYSDALGVAADPLFDHALSGTADWLLRELRHPDGGFYAALDADSEGAEGRYYVWRKPEVRRLLDDDEYLLVETLYGLDKPAGFEGTWILHRTDAWRSVVERLSLDPDTAARRLGAARAKLLAARETRPRPGLDDKVLAAWNGLAVRGLTDAALRRDRDDWLAAAEQAARFLRQRLYDEGTLYASWRQGQLGHPGFLDDYACVIDGLVALLSARWDDADAEFARALADTLLSRFEDADGGFFFTPHGQHDLFHRPKPIQDDALPAGNAVAARALSALGHLLGEPRYLDAAARTIDWALPRAAQYPAAHAALVTAARQVESGPEQIIIRGPADALGPWLAAARQGYHPRRAVFAVPYDRAATLPAQLPRLVSAELRQKVVAYRCDGLQCSAPVDDLAAFRALLA
ncbi:MAG: thioredoxin domain-containing protein [Pseudomonadales bacterium]